jgi:YD repeat-containing protein
VIGKIRRFLFVLLTLSLLRALDAQQTPDIAPGIQPSQSYSGSQFDAVNLQNGNLTAHLPLISYPQRGGKLKLSFSLLWNGKPWVPSQTCLPAPISTCIGLWTQNGSIGPEGLEVLSGMSVVDDQDVQWQAYTYTIKDADNPNYTAQEFSIAEWHTADGAIHTGGGVTAPQPGQVSIDGSGFFNGYQQNWGTGAAPPCTAHCYTTDSQGISYYVYGLQAPDPIIREDANGNQITAQKNGSGDVTGYVDTVGRVIPTPPTAAAASTSGDATGCTGTLPTYSVALWQVPGEDGSTLTFKFCYAQVNLSLPQALVKGSVVRAIQGSSLNLQSVVLPSGETWTFAYNSRSPGDPSNLNYGDLTQITFPAGGSLSYTYQFENSYCNGNSMTVLTRVRNANDALGPQTWSYSGINSGLVAVTDPLGNETDHTLTELAGNGAGCTPPYETLTKQYQGAASGGNLLKTVQTGYSFQSWYSPENPAYSTGVHSVFPTSITTTLNNGLSSLEQKTLCCSFTFSADTASFSGTYGAVASDSVYDYTASGTGPLLRQTQTTYEFQQNSAYLTANMLSLPASTVIMNGQGNTLSSKSYTYDESNYLTSSGLGPQQQLVAPVLSARGNLTTTTSWLNGGSSPQTHTNWYDTGEPYKAIDAMVNTTQLTYQCSGSLPYQVTNALGQITTYGYDCNSGLLTSVQDPNDVAAGRAGTQYAYNSSGDVTAATYPGGGGVTGNYNNYVVPLNITSTTNATPDPSIVSSVLYDGLGRPVTSTAPDGAMTVTTYDGVGNVASVSNPHFSAPSPTDGTTTYTYDALGRKTMQATQPDGSTLKWFYNGNVTTFKDEVGNSWVRTSDALGRLSNVTEPTSASTGYVYDALNNLIRVNQLGLSGETARTRNSAYDSLSRLTNDCNPETIPGGLTCVAGIWSHSYVYDANSNLTSKTDARGITTSYLYDALNRNTSRSSNAAGAITSCFSYDGASVTNGIGRIANEWTQTGSNGCSQAPASGSLITEHSILAYDPMGRIANEQRCTVAGCTQGRIHAQQYSYDLAGNRTSFTDGLGITTFGLVYDLAARLLSLTSTWNDPTHPPNLLSVQAYSPVGIANWTLGNALSLAKTYDSRTRVSSLTVQGSAQ